jgi:hypothetical protein
MSYRTKAIAKAATFQEVHSREERRIMRSERPRVPRFCPSVSASRKSCAARSMLPANCPEPVPTALKQSL